jgi:hypothetical protein
MIYKIRMWCYALFCTRKTVPFSCFKKILVASFPNSSKSKYYCQKYDWKMGSVLRLNGIIWSKSCHAAQHECSWQQTEKKKCSPVQIVSTTHHCVSSFLPSPHCSFDISHTAHTVNVHKPQGTHIITQIWFVTQATDTNMALQEDLANANNELSMKCHIQTVCDTCMQSTWL